MCSLWSYQACIPTAGSWKLCAEMDVLVGPRRSGHGQSVQTPLFDFDFTIQQFGSAVVSRTKVLWSSQLFWHWGMTCRSWGFASCCLVQQTSASHWKKLWATLYLWTLIKDLVPVHFWLQLDLISGFGPCSWLQVDMFPQNTADGSLGLGCFDSCNWTSGTSRCLQGLPKTITIFCKKTSWW